jgi:DNA-binding response OmpR family regulator
MKPRVLIVEDERAISEPLAEHLAREGFDPEVVGTVADAWDAFARNPHDLILLDVMLPDGDGRDLCRQIRKGSDVPIVMLTARGEEVDRIVGLELGADDYVVKPFSAGELVARMRAIMRRGRAGARRGPRGRRAPPGPRGPDPHESEPARRARGQGVRPAPPADG